MFNFKGFIRQSNYSEAICIQNSVEDRSLKHLEIEEVTNDLLKTNERILKHFEEVMKNM